MIYSVYVVIRLIYSVVSGNMWGVYRDTAVYVAISGDICGVSRDIMAVRCGVVSIRRDKWRYNGRMSRYEGCVSR